jgi:hypothetical protein
VARVIKHETPAKHTVPPKRPPAKTTEGRENQLISMAMDLVEERIRNGTATSQEVTHFLKLGSTREALEKDRLRQENALMKAKIEQLSKNDDMGELYREAIEAMRGYQGLDPLDTDDGDFDA